MKPINPDNVFGSAGSVSTFGNERIFDDRRAFINRPTKGKTARKRHYPPTGKKTNVGDPMLSQSSNGRKRG